MSLLILRSTASQGGGGGGDLTHGQTFALNISDKVSGTITTFGSKASNDHRWDDCSGTVITAIWDDKRPDGNTDPYDIRYRTPAGLGRGVSLPHSNITKYLCFAHYPGTNGLDGQQGYVSVEFQRANDNYTRWIWRTRCDPNWQFHPTPNENNFKWYSVTEGVGGIYGAGGEAYWYLQYSDGGVTFTSASDNPVLQTNDDSGPAGHDMISGTALNGSSSFNPVNGWIHRDLAIKWQSGATGFIVVRENNVVKFNHTSIFTDNVTDTTQRTHGIEGYSANRQQDLYRYMCDIYYDHGPNDACLYLTDNADFDSSTVVEPQPWISPGAWSSTEPTFICNKGALSAGTVHQHLRSVTQGNGYFGTRTIN